MSVSVAAMMIARRLIVCFGLTTLTSTVSFAATGKVSRFPVNVPKAKAGLDMTIDTRWVSANGYRPVTIEFKNRPPVPAVADRTLEVVLSPNRRHESFGSADISVSAIVEISEGSLGASVTIPVPQSRHWSSLGVETWEDARLWKELSDIVVVTGGGTYSEAIPTILVIDSAAPLRDQRGTAQNRNGIAQSAELPDVSVLLERLTVSNVSVAKGNGDLSTLQNVQNVGSFELLQPAELPDNWINYSAFDLAFISLDELRRLITERPSKWNALRDWNASGATLCVNGIGAEFERLAKLEELLKMQPSADALRGGDGLWDTPTKRHFATDIKALANLDQRYGQRMLSGTNQPPSPPPQRNIPPKPMFATREFNVGTVVAFGADQVFPGDEYQWGFLFNTIPSQRWMWYQRHGLSLQRVNRDYWKFLIPGVGLAPVKSFLILISLFALVIGPVNYVVLRRWRRIYLLMVTVPVGAAIVTACLLAWAILGDGLSTRVRIRSLTDVDQASGQTVSWSRHSYYAGMVPSGGFTFPLDALVYPIEHIPKPGERRTVDRQLVWTSAGGQNYRNGYMGSRVNSQFLVGRSHPTSRRLELLSPMDGQPPHIENKLGTRLIQLLLRDADGNYFWGQDLSQGEKLLLAAIDMETATQRWRDRTAGHDPDFPPGYDAVTSEFTFGGASYYVFGWSTDSSMPKPTAETGILEIALDRMLQSNNINLEKRCYLAIVDRPPEVPLGIEAAKEEASFHVIRGRLGP